MVLVLFLVARLKETLADESVVSVPLRNAGGKVSLVVVFAVGILAAPAEVAALDNLAFGYLGIVFRLVTLEILALLEVFTTFAA